MKKYAAGSAVLAVGIIAGMTVNAAAGEAAGGTHIRLREASRTITVPAGGQDFVASDCGKKEAVTGGGPTNIPASLTIVYSTLIYRGNGTSGWIVQYKNEGAGSVTETPATGALCVAPGHINP